MADIINLNKARKLALKKAGKAEAVNNRIVYGISTKFRKKELYRVELINKTLEQACINAPKSNKTVDE